MARKSISLRKRISKMISWSNFISLLIMLIGIMVVFTGTVKMISEEISESLAVQVKSQIEHRMNDTVNKNKKAVSFFDSQFEMSEIGTPYALISNMEETIHKKGKKTAEQNNENSNTENQELIIYYKIWDKEKLVYDSLKPKKAGPEGIISREIFRPEIINKFSTASKVNILDKSENIAGYVEVGLNPKLLYGGIMFILAAFVMLFIFILILSQVLVKMFTGIIIKPLSELDKKMSVIAKGDIENAIRSEIKFKKPVIEIEKLVQAANEIISRMREYVNKLESQNDELESQNNALSDSRKELENTNLELDNKVLKLKNVLDNTEQGFLMFKRDIIIKGEYSLECERIFGQKIENINFVKLVFSENDNMINFTEECLKKVFDSSVAQRGLYMSLLPEETKIEDKAINLSYKIVRDEKNEDIMMVILTDITEKRNLEKKMDEERKKLKMVVSAIINRDDFIKLVKEYKNFAIMEIGRDNCDKESIMRQIHTFKGSFGQYDMLHTVPGINEIETELLKSNGEKKAEIKGQALLQPLAVDIEIIKKYAGNEFMDEGEKCIIDKEKLIQIEEKINETLEEKERKEILPLIKKLRYRSLKNMLSSYNDYTIRLSERLGKNIKHFEIEGDDIQVDPNNYYEVIKVLGHIFRNSVDHGIESEDERLENGKEEAGTISCLIKNGKTDFQIIISDDGRGIDTLVLREKGIERQLFSSEEFEKMAEKEKNELVFLQGMTTKENPTYYSGRGVGMAAVKKCIEENEGTIEVKSSMGQGTSFIITLKKHDIDESAVVTPEEFLGGLVDTAVYFMLRKTEMKFEKSQLRNENVIELKEITALINLKGNINSIIMISVNHEMAEKMVESMAVFEVSRDEIPELIEDVLGEVLNTILGNTLGIWKNTDNTFHVGLPAVIFNSGGYVKYTQSQILAYELICDKYEISINMLIITKADSELEFIESNLGASKK